MVTSITDYHVGHGLFCHPPQPSGMPPFRAGPAPMLSVLRKPATPFLPQSAQKLIFLNASEERWKKLPPLGFRKLGGCGEEILPLNRFPHFSEPPAHCRGKDRPSKKKKTPRFPGGKPAREEADQRALCSISSRSPASEGRGKDHGACRLGKAISPQSWPCLYLALWASANPLISRSHTSSPLSVPKQEVCLHNNSFYLSILKSTFPPTHAPILILTISWRGREGLDGYSQFKEGKNQGSEWLRASSSSYCQ